jgi:hypothetical protein
MTAAQFEALRILSDGAGHCTSRKNDGVQVCAAAARALQRRCFARLA